MPVSQLSTFNCSSCYQVDRCQRRNIKWLLWIRLYGRWVKKSKLEIIERKPRQHSNGAFSKFIRRRPYQSHLWGAVSLQQSRVIWKKFQINNDFHCLQNVCSNLIYMPEKIKTTTKDSMTWQLRLICIGRRCPTINNFEIDEWHILELLNEYAGNYGYSCNESAYVTTGFFANCYTTLTSSTSSPKKRTTTQLYNRHLMSSFSRRFVLGKWDVLVALARTSISMNVLGNWSFLKSYKSASGQRNRLKIDKKLMQKFEKCSKNLPLLLKFGTITTIKFN